MQAFAHPGSHVLRPTLRWLSVLLVVVLAGCAIAKPRTDDPWQSFNRKTFAFNRSLDKAVVRPAAVAYRKVTNPPVRQHISDFFSNIRLPVSIANDLLQAKPGRAFETTGRFLVNLTVGLLGFFDPASKLGLAPDDNDFGVTLARWGVPDGPYLVLPFFGPTTARDVWRFPVDSYFFDPLSIYARKHKYPYGQQYLPTLIYLVNLRSQAFSAESFLESAYDPYVFLRDAYRQHRLYLIYYGNPPAAVIERMQGLDQSGFDPDALLKQQQQWEKTHQPSPAAAASTSAPVQPATPASTGQP